jgi:hypothetical protein
MQDNEDTVVEEVSSKPKGSKWEQWEKFRMSDFIKGFLNKIWDGNNKRG